MKKIGSIVIVCVLLLSSCTAEKDNHENTSWEASSVKTIASQLHTQMQNKVDAREKGGYAIGLIQNNKVQLLKGYGKRSDEMNVTKNTFFQIGSSTHLFTSILTGLMVDYRQLEWNSRIQDLMPEFELSQEWISHSLTIDDILLERSPLPANAGSFLPILGFDQEYIFTHMNQFKIDTQFREKYNPVNILSISQTRLIDLLMNDSWENTLRKEITNPASIETTLGTTEYYNQKQFVYPYYMNENNEITQYPIGSTVMMKTPDILESSLGIGLNIQNALGLIQLYCNKGTLPTKEKIISEKAFDELMLPIYRKGKGLFTDNAFATRSGFTCEMIGGDTLYWCVGYGYGFQSFFLMIPEKQIGLTFLTNISNTNDWVECANTFMQGIYDVEPLELTYVSRASDEVPLRLMIEPLPVDSYVGTYQHSLYGDIPIVKNGQDIGLILGKNGEYKSLTHYNADVYYFYEPTIFPTKIYVSFQRDDNNYISSCTIDYMKDTLDPFFIRVSE